MYEQVQATIDYRDIVGGNMVGNQSVPNVNENPFREDFRSNTFNDSKESTHNWYVSKQTLNDGMVDAASSMMSSETWVDSSDTLANVGEPVPSPYKMMRALVTISFLASVWKKRAPSRTTSFVVAVMSSSMSKTALTSSR